MLFIDEVVIRVKAGNGGDGCVSFRREKYVPKGGPDGGDGGNGGSVYLVTDPHMSTLADFRYNRVYNAGNGGVGMGRKKHGKNGEDLRIPVPAGTLVREDESRRVLVDLVEPGQDFLLARGGKGGGGNTHFASPTNQTPLFARDGKAGEELSVILELKLIADVGLVGLPNAGKSTLLSRISAARPKIADYPFTTIKPMLGVVNCEGEGFVVADIPGIIEGAHEGKGMGLSFLRHLERTLFIAVLVDVSSPNPSEDYRQIRRELKAYSECLWEKPHSVVFTKCDLLPGGGQPPDIGVEKPLDVYQVSSVSGAGLERMKWGFSSSLASLKAAEKK